MIISSDMKREIILTREIQDKSCQKEKELQPDNTKLLWSLAILVPEDLKGRHLYSTQKYSEILVQLKKYRLQEKPKSFVLVHFSAWASLENNVNKRASAAPVIYTFCKHLVLQQVFRVQSMCGRFIKKNGILRSF